MNILIYSDVHFSQDSSIVRSMGEKYSTRLEYLIKSLNWAEELAEKEKCACIINLGDTFDKSTLNAMEITALKEIKWSSLEHFVLVGNHDSNINSLEYNSSEILSNISHFHIISRPEELLLNNSLLHFIPYITEDNRKTFNSYVDKSRDEELHIERHIVFSHNNIKGFQFGKFKSPEGFDIQDIESNCDLYLNGHLHTPSFLTKKIVNIGNLCGQNFSENNFKTKHGAWILDIDTLSLTFYENPYALNFYKIEINKQNPSLSSYDIGNNACLMIKCERTYVERLKEELNNRKDIVASKVIVYDENIINNTETNVKIEKVDYIKIFSDFIIDKLGNSDIINSEINEICK